MPKKPFKNNKCKQWHKSFVGDIPYSNRRHDEINQKLRELVEITEGTLTQIEIAEYCGMSKQAVYQIEKSACRKIARKYPELKQELMQQIYLSIF